MARSLPESTVSVTASYPPLGYAGHELFEQLGSDPAVLVGLVDEDNKLALVIFGEGDDVADDSVAMPRNVVSAVRGQVVELCCSLFRQCWWQLRRPPARVDVGIHVREEVRFSGLYGSISSGIPSSTKNRGQRGGQ